VAGAVLSRIALPQKILILGVRHFPRGEPAAILSSGAWRTPLGDTAIDRPLAEALRAACPLLREDSVAHSGEHSLEVQLPFLQLLAPAVAMLTALRGLGAQHAALVRYATSADVSGDTNSVVGYAGMVFT
jgi:AmmeMemoRadiSam system protein B